MDDVALGGDDEFPFRRGEDEVQDRTGGADVIGMIEDALVAFRVRRDQRVGMAGLELHQFAGGKPVMDDAGAVPQDHFAAGLAGQIGAQVLVGREQDRLVLGQLVDDVFGVGRGDDDVGKRLHLGRAIDVGEGDVVRMGGAEAGEVVGRAGFLQRAAGVGIGQHHRFVGAQDLRHLGHEADPGKNDHIGVRGRGPAGQVEGIADEIGQILNLPVLVIMGQDDGVLLTLEAVDLGPRVQGRIKVRFPQRLGVREDDGFHQGISPGEPGKCIISPIGKKVCFIS